MKLCKDCGVKLFSNAPMRCIPCRAELRRLTQKNNKLKYQYHKTPKARYNTYVRGAIRRNLSFEITLDEFILFWQKPCHYCGDNIDTIGLDRIKNNEGYTMQNTISCCKGCNYMKHTMTKENFINKCVKIVSVSLLQS